MKKENSWVKRVLLRFLLALVLLAVGGAAIACYCYGPVLPVKTVRFDYHRGWLAAWRAALDGRYAYSFDRYMVDGLADYALRKDGITAVVVPAEIRSAPYYLAGFDSYMAGRLKKKLACDFPDGYVKTYLETGSLDLTKGQPIECPVHKRPMVLRRFLSRWFSPPPWHTRRLTERLQPKRPSLFLAAA